jgi:hypothetical protein
MNIQLIVVMGVGLFLAMWTGIAVGNGEYGKAGFVAGGTLLAVLIAVIGRRYRFEGWFIAIIVACYFLGGKGFSYQRLVSILFVGEATLILLVVFHVFRVMTGAARLIPKHRLTIPLLIFLVYGFIHLLIDLREFPLILVFKDSATAYYALFFFIVYGPMQHKPTRDYILKLLPFIATAALVLFSFYMFLPGTQQAITSATMVRGAPVILPTIDSMIPVCIGFSAFAYFKSLQTSGILRVIYLLASILCTAPLFTFAKAVFYIAFFTYLFALVCAGHWKIMFTIIPIGILSVLMLVTLNETGVIKDRNGKLTRFLSEFSSFDILGVGGASQKHAQRTVEWRLTWWIMITEDVMSQSPFYGLGFGSDISSKFHSSFNKASHVNTNKHYARYPHNIVFTVLGRMGLIGLLIFIPIIILIIRELWIGFMVLRRTRKRCDPKYAFAWAFVLGGFSNAFFQSTFEAPYTAIMFWTLLAVLAVMNQNIVVASEAKISSTGADEDTVSEGINLAGVGKPVPT